MKDMLNGKKGVILGVANNASIAYGCAKVISNLGGKLALNYGKEKTKKYVEPLLSSLNVELYMPMDVSDPAQVKAFFAAVAKQFGNIDFLIHSIAFCPQEDLHGRVVDSSAEGFMQAVNLSCHSFIEASKYGSELMNDGGSIIAMTYYGSEKVIPDYSVMGPVKAILESSVRYVARDLGGKKIRVNAISPGPIQTRAASGIQNFGNLLTYAYERAPIKDGVSIDDVGNLAAFLVSDMATKITGSVIYVDCGSHIMG